MIEAEQFIVTNHGVRPGCQRCRGRRGLRSTDQLLQDEPPLGAHIVTPRWGYAHHGIYVGHGRVVHYSGLSCGLRRGPVAEIRLAEFARGQVIFLRSHRTTLIERDEVIRRARQRLGENCYRVLTNNCEHFCEWCVRGEHRSYQVDQLLRRIDRTRRRLLELFDWTSRFKKDAAGLNSPQRT